MEKHGRSDYASLLNMSSLGINKKNPNNFFHYFRLAPLGEYYDIPEEESLIITIFTLIFTKKLQIKYFKPTINWTTSRLRHISNRNSVLSLNEKNITG